MNKMVKGCLATVMAFGVMSGANADLIPAGGELVFGTEYENASGDSYGMYLGTFGGNDAQSFVTDVETAVINATEFSRQDEVLDLLSSAAEVGRYEVESVPVIDNLTVVGTDQDGDEILAGTWAIDDGTLIDFYAVKAGNKESDGGYTAWWLDTPTDHGIFTTYGLKINNDDEYTFRGLSHLSGYASTSTSVPEPTTTALLGISLLLLGFLPKRKKR